MIGRANINEHVILRPVFCNAQSTQSTFDSLLEEIIKQGDSLTMGEETQDKKQSDPEIVLNAQQSVQSQQLI